MTNENTEIVVSHQEIDLKVEAKKQLRIATVDFFKCAKKPTTVSYTHLTLPTTR